MALNAFKDHEGTQRHINQGRTRNVFIQESIWIVETVNCILYGLFDCVGTFVMVDCHNGALLK